MNNATQKLMDDARSYAREGKLPAPAHAHILALADALEAAQRSTLSQESPRAAGHYQDDQGRHWLHQVYDGSAYGAPDRDADQWLDPWGRVARPPVNLVRLLTAAEWEDQHPTISPEVREALPVVAHKGPHDTDESMFLTAADNLDQGYQLGGGNLTRAVVGLIRREVSCARRAPLDPEDVAGWIEDNTHVDWFSGGPTELATDLIAALPTLTKNGES